MKIKDMQVNHITEPMGYDLGTQTFSWRYETSEEAAEGLKEKGAAAVTACRVIVAGDRELKETVSDSGFQRDITGIAYEQQLVLAPRTRYFWKAAARLSDGRVIESPVSWFETGKLNEAWQGNWIGIRDPKGQVNVTEGERPSPIVRKTFWITKKVKNARIYMTGLGLYECCLNGELFNDGYLQPGFHNYNYWLQYQTRDITDHIQQGENVLAFLLGAGWYKGRFGVNGGFENNFGNNYHVLCELHLQYNDGTEEIIGSDGSFRYTDGPVRFSNIYDGEIYDATAMDGKWLLPGFDDSGWRQTELLAPEKLEKLTERFSLPVVIKERRKPMALINGPQGEKILDIGQNVVGWLVFPDMLEKGQTVTLRFAELLEDGALCTKNLLTARQEFIYTSAGAGTEALGPGVCGTGSLVRPHFTYFGFRYVQLEGFPQTIKAEDFQVWNLYSDMETTGSVSVGNDAVNQFIQNAFWSQRDNFLEHPSDCPQRAERLGWTGDAQIYGETASYFMDTTAFFRKYLKDVNEEQLHKNGLVPFIVPKIAGRGFEESTEDECSAAWSDVATVLPWMLYVHFGDKNLLGEQYAGMKAWVDYMIRKDEENGGNYLWQSGFHFGDWLALDNPQPGPFGKTDQFYIASCYYYYSASLTAKAAAVLGKAAEARSYGARAAAVHKAILSEYFDGEQICTIDTQTAYAVAIYMDLVTGEALLKNGRRLAEKLAENNGHLDTGFVGTPYLCPALTKAGYHDVACQLLLKEDYPSWLYQVKQGATTVWEAWDALDENGRLTRDASLNHYAFGSIVGWIYKEVCGIKPMEEYPGFAKALLEPKPSRLLGQARAALETPAGRYEVSWAYGDGHTVRVQVRIPFGGSAVIRLPWAERSQELAAGSYEFCCQEPVRV